MLLMQRKNVKLRSESVKLLFKQKSRQIFIVKLKLNENWKHRIEPQNNQKWQKSKLQKNFKKISNNNLFRKNKKKNLLINRIGHLYIIPGLRERERPSGHCTKSEFGGPRVRVRLDFKTKVVDSLDKSSSKRN